MTARILGIELRRSAAPWVGLGTAVAGVAMLYLAVGGWGARWMLLALWQREFLFVLLPVALGAGAWQASRDGRTRMAELIATTARPRWRRVLPAVAAMAVTAVLGYAAMYGAGAVQTALTATYFPSGSVAIAAVGALWMVAGVWLGMAIGGLVPSRLTPAALAIAAAAVPLAVTGDRSEPAARVVHLLTPSPFGFYGDFVTVSGRVSLAHAAWLVGLAATGLALYASPSRAARLIAVAPAAVGATAALFLMPAGPETMPRPDAAAAALVCTTDPGPRVCVRKVHGGLLPDLREPARAALATFAAKLPDAPASVEESLDPWDEEDPRPQPRDTLVVDLEPTLGGGATEGPEELRWRLLDGAGTRPCVAVLDRPQLEGSHHAARLAAAAWLAGRPPPDGQYGSEARAAWERLRAMPAVEQRARVAALREAALRCTDLDLLRVLLGDRVAR